MSGSALNQGSIAPLVAVGKTNLATGFTLDGGTANKILTVDTDKAITDLMNKTGSNLAIGSDADGDMYYRASSVLARLAKGAANLKMFMNAGATAPEWANGIKIGNFSRVLNVASGDVSYTGVGFKPSNIIFLGVLGGDVCMSVGMDDGTNHHCLYDNYRNAADQYGSAASYSITAIPANGQSTQGLIKTLDSDGFTITWTLTGAGIANNFNVYYMAFR